MHGARRRSLADGAVPIDEIVWENTRKLAASVGVAMPEQIFSSYFASERIPLVLAFLALPALVWTKRHARWELAASVAVAALILVKMTLVVQQWRVSDRLYAEAVAAIKTIAPQSRVYSIIVNDEPRMLPDTPFLELSPLAAWEMYGEPVPAAGLRPPPPRPVSARRGHRAGAGSSRSSHARSRRCVPWLTSWP